MLPRCKGRRVDGLLLVSTYRSKRTSLTSRLKKIPTVAVDRPIVGFKCDCVLVHNHDAAYNATRHLWVTATAVCVRGYCERIYTVSERIEGYTRAMLEAKLKLNGQRFQSGGCPEPGASSTLDENPAHGYVGSNTMVMHGIMQAAAYNRIAGALKSGYRRF